MTGSNAITIVLDMHGFAFETGLSFRGLTISETSTGFNCVLRAWEKSGSPVYAMTVADDPQEGITRLWLSVSAGNGSVLWRHDKYASARGG